MPNSRISDLNETTFLNSQSSMEPFPNSPIIPSGNLDNDVYFLIAREKSHNESVKYNSLKSSLVDCVTWLTGNQLISGQKVFADECTFLSRTNVSEILDATPGGDISGNIFVGTTGLLQNAGIGTPFFERLNEPSFTLHASGDFCFFGDFIHTGNLRQYGDLLRIGNSSLSGELRVTGDRFITGDEHFIGNKYQTGNLHCIGDSYKSGDSLIRGKTSQIGDVYYSGNSWRSGDNTLIGDSSVIGDLTINGDAYYIGDTFISGDTFETGDATIFGDNYIDGDIYTPEYLYHLADKNTHFRFLKNNLELKAGDNVSIEIDERSENKILFNTSNQERIRLTKEGELAINNSTPISDLSVSGRAFTENVLSYDNDFDKKFLKVFGGDDETSTFKYQIRKGSDKYKIDLPKTFKVKPIISVDLENKDGGIIHPLFVSDITIRDFYVNFGSIILLDSYVLHITALSPSVLQGVNAVHYQNFPHVTCSDHAQNRHGIQRFYTPIQSVTNTQEIYFPFGFDSSPIVSVTIEGPNNIIPYVISSVNNNSYTITFGSNVNQNYTVHTFSSNTGQKRLG